MVYAHDLPLCSRPFERRRILACGRSCPSTLCASAPLAATGARRDSRQRSAVPSQGLGHKYYGIDCGLSRLPGQLGSQAGRARGG